MTQTGRPTNGQRALAIRDHVLALIQDRGTIKPVGEVRVVMWQAGLLSFLLRTPFSRWSQVQGAPSYAHALAHQEAHPVLPYGLDVVRGPKVMSLRVVR